MRHKIPENKKKVKFAISIDEELSIILEKYLIDNKIKNKSRYIENLVRRNIEEKGIIIEREF